MVIMNLNILNGKKHIHFIGIGGSGMYPLAQILHSWGYYLTGSDPVSGAAAEPAKVISWYVSPVNLWTPF